MRRSSSLRAWVRLPVGEDRSVRVRDAASEMQRPQWDFEARLGEAEGVRDLYGGHRRVVCVAERAPTSGVEAIGRYFVRSRVFR